MKNKTRTFEELEKLAAKGHLYIFCEDTETEDRFVKDAEDAGILCGDGEKPTVRGGAQLVTLYENRTISFPGMAGHMAFKMGKKLGDKKIIRVNYKRFMSGEKYLI